MLLTVQSVRLYKALTTAAVYGDGQGTENPIDCRGANSLVLLLSAKRVGATADTRVAIEWSSGDDSSYSDTVSAAGATATTRRVEYKIDTTSWANGELRNWALRVEVEGRWARVSAKSTVASDPELSILALTGMA